jgi:hypothetical protein
VSAGCTPQQRARTHMKISQGVPFTVLPMCAGATRKPAKMTCSAMKGPGAVCAASGVGTR